MDESTLLAELTAAAGGVNVVAHAVPVDISLPSGWTHLPLATVAPGSAEEIATIVRICEAAGAALVVVGGGTQLQTGYPPRADKPYLLLSTRRLNRILDYQPDDMTITCEPGVTLAQVQAHLNARRQLLPLLIPEPERATMGGIVSTNLSGFWRSAFGAPRDLVIGLHAVATEGARVKGGGKVVKNVAGYDVCKLFTGAWGTVGVITEITFRVRPQPPAERLLCLNAPDIAVAAKAGLTLHHAQTTPIALLATNEVDENEVNGTEGKGTEGKRMGVNGTPCLLILLQGSEARMDWQTQEIARQAGEHGLSAPNSIPLNALNRLCDRQARHAPDTLLAGRISCLLTDVEPLLQKLEALPGIRLTADIAMGTVAFAAHETAPDVVKAIVSAVPADANLLWTRIEGALSDRPDISALDVWGQTRETTTLQRALKQSLDPKAHSVRGDLSGEYKRRD